MRPGCSARAPERRPLPAPARWPGQCRGTLRSRVRFSLRDLSWFCSEMGMRFEVRWSGATPILSNCADDCSAGGLAAVRGEDLSGDEGGLLRGHEDDRARDLIR